MMSTIIMTLLAIAIVITVSRATALALGIIGS